MSQHDDLAHVLNTGLVAIVRAASGERLADVAEALLSGGIDVVEITFTVPQAHSVLEAVAARLGDRVLLGAGTVLDPETARIALLAGARYVVTPVVQPDVIETCLRYDALCMCGAFTPTEILSAWQRGAQIVKVFPADVGGPGYLKSVAGPLPQVRLMPTGGVNLNTAAEFLRAGACALGVGNSLVEPQAIATGNLARIESLAKQYVQIVREFRRGPQGLVV